MDKKKKLIIAAIAIVVLIIIICVIVFATKSDKDSSGESKKNNIEISKVGGANAEKITEVNLEESIKTDDFEMTIMSAKFLKELKVQTSSSSTSSNGANSTYTSSSSSTSSRMLDDGKQAFVLQGNFKTLRGEKIDRKAIAGKVIIDDKYTYDLDMWLPSASGFEPLYDTSYYFFAQIPDDLVDTYQTAKFIFGYNDNLNAVMNKDDMDNMFSLTVTK